MVDRDYSSESFNVIIDFYKSPYFKGLGDLCLTSWIATAYNSPIRTKPERKELVEVLGLEYTELEGTGFLSANSAEMQDNAKLPRIEYIKRALGVTEHKQPIPQINESSLRRGKTAKDAVLIFPFAAWEIRNYPVVNWVELCHQLTKKKIKHLVMLPKRDNRFKNQIIAKSFSDLAGFIVNSLLVVGNDSFGAHFATSLNKKTLAVFGPTRATNIYGHCLDILEPMESDFPCRGCNFVAQYRPECQQGCSALYSISPIRLATRISEKISEN